MKKLLENKKRILLLASFALMLLITVISVSYAFLSSSVEKKNTFTIITGELAYELTSSGLDQNRQVTIESGGSTELTLEVKSLNDIPSTYKLFYNGENIPEGVTVSYFKNDNYSGSGDLQANESHTIEIRITNSSSEPVTLTIGVQGGLYQKELTLNEGYAIDQMISGDVMLAWRFEGEGEAPSSFPKKDEGYWGIAVECTNGIGEWDNGSWSVNVSDISGSGAVCTVTFKSMYTDNSGANPPELIDGMIPVIWNGTDWVKTDTGAEWYNYDTQMWANAVTVTSASRSEYNSASANTVILMDDIETMWVWIPRYSYTIKSSYGVQGYGGSAVSQSTPGAIDIKFIDVDTKETGSATYSGTSPENYRTPDGFTFGSQELPGIWVAKFETSSTTPSASYGGGNTTSYDPLVKPDVSSWRDINVSNAFAVSQKLTAEGNRYGLDTNADGHMMKNSEWGLVAYLSQSKYGKYGNENYTGTNKEVYKNNSSSYYTGRSKGSAPATNTDDTSAGSYTYAIEGSGTGASTTGTIYGVYDMSGGAWDYTMSNYNGTIDGAGFSSLPDSKYYDRYTTDNASTACNGGTCYGHALGETAKWYRDTASMVDSSWPWAQRGGAYNIGSIAGVFYFNSGNGDNGSNSSFRLVLAPGA